MKRIQDSRRQTSFHSAGDIYVAPYSLRQSQFGHGALSVTPGFGWEDAYMSCRPKQRCGVSQVMQTGSYVDMGAATPLHSSQVSLFVFIYSDKYENTWMWVLV